MLNNDKQALSLSDRQVRHALAVRIGMVLLAFFAAAWCLLQWTLSSEMRFTVEGFTRQFVVLEAFTCAGVAIVAFVFTVVNAIGWLATSIRLRRERNGHDRKLAVKRSLQRVGAYV